MHLTDHDEEGDDIGQFSLDERDREAPAPGAGGPGYVYVISNPSMPDLLKVGLTARPVEDRMYDLHSTGVPTPFVKEFAVHVEDARIVEQGVHDRLREYRVSANREFFRCGTDVARDNLMAAADGLITNASILPEFASYHEALREDLQRTHRNEILDRDRKLVFWRRSALALSVPGGLFILIITVALAA